MTVGPMFFAPSGGGGGGGGGSSTILFDPNRKHSNITLSSADSTASTQSTNGHYKAFSTGPKNSGKWLVEFTIEARGTNVGFGITNQASSHTDSNFPYTDANSGSYWGSPSLCRHYNGTAFVELSTSLSPITGDVFTVTFDFSNKEMSVYRNGSLASTRTISSIDLTGALVYVPFVALWGQGGVPSTVRINSTISHPVAGFAPWVA